MTHLENKAMEEGTYTVTVGTTFTPTAMTWRLMDEDGTVQNSRSTVSVSSPSTATQITLTSNDLALGNRKKVRRWFLAKGTYSAGSKSFADECTFDIQDLKGIT